MTQLSIVIPAYNEERRIRPMLTDYLAFFQSADVELIVVLNGCTDRTLEIVQEFQKQYPTKLRYLNLEQALGKGGAVKAGLLAATGNWRGFVDADASTAPAELNRLWQLLKPSHYDGVIASRWLPGAQVWRSSWLRKFASWLFVWLVRRRFHMPFFDTQCGAKIFTTTLVEAIMPNLSVINMAFDVELLYNATKQGYRFLEVPTVWVDKTSSTLFRSPFGFIKNSYQIFKTILTIKR
ncbi:MAG: dolichyl-phosphate beta-glucosyltransferase [Patescibacteria group bacterium]|jgi:glycosyltransferase involved in cell wall biosynthesis